MAASGRWGGGKCGIHVRKEKQWLEAGGDMKDCGGCNLAQGEKPAQSNRDWTAIRVTIMEE